jgi:hypothetical protein
MVISKIGNVLFWAVTNILCANVLKGNVYRRMFNYDFLPTAKDANMPGFNWWQAGREYYFNQPGFFQGHVFCLRRLQWTCNAYQQE